MQAARHENVIDEIIDFFKEEQNRNPLVYVDKTVMSEFVSGDIRPRPVVSDPVHVQDRRVYEKPAQYVAPKSEQMKPAVPSGLPEIGNMEMDELSKTVSVCNRCVLCPTRKNTVFGEGNPHAELMFIGEGPGQDEDEQGRPFVGKAGQLLTKMIKAMGYEREDVYIANIVKCRPPNNRNPEPEEAAACIPYLERQIEIIRPKVIIILGAVALKFLLNQTGITRLRGQWLEYKGMKVMPTFHPSYLLRDESQKKYAWADLQKVMAFFGKTPKKA